MLAAGDGKGRLFSPVMAGYSNNRQRNKHVRYCGRCAHVSRDARK